MEIASRGYCGIDCKNFCIMGNSRLLEQARELEKSLRELELEKWYRKVKIPQKEMFEFEELIKGLKWLQRYGHCPGCKHGGGIPNCKVGACVKSKELNGCWECKERGSCGIREGLKNLYPAMAKAMEMSEGMEEAVWNGKK